MNFHFYGDLEEIREGLPDIARLLGWQLTPAGTPVRVCKTEAPGMELRREGNGWSLAYREKAHFFRALGFLQEQKSIREVCHFQSCGFQLDLSQTNAVLQLPQMQELMCRMALMGYNLLVLYMEDTFEIPEEPYFGYMRSRYSEDELRTIDALGARYGIEVMPMVEGLAHLSTVLRWPDYGSMQENASTVLVGEPRTYAYFEHVLDAATKPFRSKRIFIALDEAFHLGRGETLTRTGVYQSPFDLLRAHVERLAAMCAERGLEFVTTGDMFMLANNPTGHPFERIYGTDRPLDPKVKAAANLPVNYTMWDYSHLEEETYEKLFARYREFGKCDYFLAGIWNWLGFGVDYTKTFATVVPGLRAAKKCGISHASVSCWGNDSGSENFWSDLLLGLQLFAEHCYGDEPDEQQLHDRFMACTGCEVEDFFNLSYVDHLFDEAPRPGPGYTNFSRSLLWQDMLFGIFDYHIHDDSLTAHFAKAAALLEQASTRNGAYGKYLETRAMCARVMEIKAAMGYRISQAYKNGDRAALEEIVNHQLPELTRRVKALHARHRELWYAVYKPLGWEAEDLRYGALLGRIDTVAYRLTQYLSGEVSELTELTETRLSMTGSEEMPRAYSYLRSVTGAYLEPYS